MKRVLVLGAGGMLGSMVARVFAATRDLEVTRGIRGPAGDGAVAFDIENDSMAQLLAEGGFEWIVNAAGVLKHLIDERDDASVARAMAVNAAFPHRLAKAAGDHGARVIHTGTDGVFSGRDGPYDERAEPDAEGVYERSKAEGEVQAPHVLNLRCSIIGPEERTPSSLLGWALSQPTSAHDLRIHQSVVERASPPCTWPGCAAAIIGAGELELPSPLHVVPGDAVTKAELLQLILSAFGRRDVTVSPGAREGTGVPTSSSTRHPERQRGAVEVGRLPRAPDGGGDGLRAGVARQSRLARVPARARTSCSPSASART